MKSLLRIPLVCLLATSLSFAQDLEDKKPLDHADYDLWNTVRQTSLSNDGKWVMYSVVDGKDRSTLRIRESAGSKEFTAKNASSGRFTYHSKRALFVVQPDPDMVKKLRKDKKTGDIPKPKLQILTLAT
ncbi:MAG: hypothetical protein AB8G99_23025, partial [Planctomycetaceae bacterium]